MSTAKDKSFYNSQRWLRLRRAILERDGWMCQMAKMQGRKVPAVTVHHILPRSEYPEYQWCDWNLISLSYAAHDHMHIRDTDQLSEAGEALKAATAQARGIELRHKQVIVVIGMPGTGKTSYVTDRMRGHRNDLVYDLDAIAGALRLKGPKDERCKPARLMADLLFSGFASQALKYADTVYVIRTAPTIEQLIDMHPTRLVICEGGYGNQDLTPERRHSLAQRIRDAAVWAERNGVPVEEIKSDH